MAEEPLVLYWDASAILSVLFADVHSEDAVRWAEREGVHMISSLAHGEVCAVIARMERERILSTAVVKTCFETLAQGPWRYITSSPDREIVEALSWKSALRGADLWHLAAAKSLERDLHELKMLTFDKALQEAARTEGLASD